MLTDDDFNKKVPAYVVCISYASEGVTSIPHECMGHNLLISHMGKSKALYPAAALFDAYTTSNRVTNKC